MAKNNTSISSIFPSTQKLQGKYNARPVELFRIAFGLVIFIQALHFLAIDFVQKDIVKPIIHFHYPGLDFIQPLPAGFLYTLLVGILIAGILIVLGKYLKFALAFFFIAFTYLWLLDMGYFNNHYYLLSLFAFLLFLIPGLGQNKWKIKQSEIKHSLPYWSVFLLRFQWFIVFFIAGLNKLNKYWLVDFQPMKATFEFKASHTGNDLWEADIWPFLFSYGGTLFDLSIGFLLVNKRTRRLAFFLLLGFNLFNWLFFLDIGEIGIFPLFVMSSILVFFDAIPIKKKSKKKRVTNIKVAYFIWAWMAFQALFPFRHFLYSGYVDWTGERQRFSWRMKIAYKDFDMKFFVQNEQEGIKYPIAIEKTLTPKQYTNLGYQPDFLPQIGRFLAKEAGKQGVQNPIVTADFQVSFNGRQKQYIIDPDLPLNKIRYNSFKHNDWILLLESH